MRIALVLHTYAESGGGAERSGSLLSRGLLSRGHEVHVFAYRFRSDCAPAVPHRVPTRTLTTGWKYASFARNSERQLRRETFDVIHSFARTTYQDVLRLGGGIHAEYLRRVSRLGSLLPGHRTQLRLERAGIESSGRIVVLSERGREEVLRHYRVPRGKVVVIPNGVDGNRFSPELRSRRRKVREVYGLRDDEPVFLFCGFGARRKGLRYAIEAIGRLPRGRLLVVGERVARSARVVPVGPTSDVEDYYGAADALVLPSLYDAFPNVCLEAMASGLPVVTTRVTGIAEILTDARDGFVLEEGRDVASLASRMEALTDPDRCVAMGRAARATAERFGPDRCVEANLRLYEEVLRRKRARP